MNEPDNILWDSEVMNQKFKLIIFSSIAGAIILTLYLIFQSEAVNDMPERSDRTSITLVQQPTSDWEAVQLSDFARVVQLTKIDLTCIPRLPEGILQKQLPTKIFIATTKVVDKFGGIYAMLLDFDTWAVGYGGRVVLGAEGLDFSICPHDSKRVSVFVYSRKEESVVNLFRDLATYPNIKAYFNPLFSADDYQEISQPNQIAAISDQLKQAQCIDPKTLSRGE
ncbi:hypothetical protein FBQ95_12995 [Chloroflexi bacterium CFX3]|nr:hypothetical protein [Chloroflexi bacterium CFX3]